MQRQGRLADAIEFERQAKALNQQAKAHRERAARDAYRRNNGGANVNNMQDVNLHELTVPQAMTKVHAAVGERGQGRGQGWRLAAGSWGRHSGPEQR